MEIRGRITSRSHRLSPGGTVPGADAGCSLPAAGRAGRGLTVVLVGTARLRDCLVSPLPPGFPHLPVQCYQLRAAQGSRAAQNWHQAGAGKHGKSSGVSIPVQRLLGTFQPGLQPVWYPAPQAPHPSKCGSAAQTSPLPARSGFSLSSPGCRDLLLVLISSDGSIPRAAMGACWLFSTVLGQPGGCGKALGVVGPEPHPAWTCLCPGERSPT